MRDVPAGAPDRRSTGSQSGSAQPGGSRPSGPTADDSPRRTVPVRRVAVGKWPEGIASVGSSLWIAESGQRTIAELDPASLRLTRRLPIGRLPVSMGTDANGALYVAVVTDRTIARLAPGSRAPARVATITGTINHLKVSGTIAWALTWPNDSSSEIAVVGIDTRSGRATTHARLSAGLDYEGADSDFAVVGNRIWIGFHNGDLLVLNRTDGTRVERFSDRGGAINAVAADGDRAVIAGVLTRTRAGSPGTGIVVVLDNDTMRPFGVRELPQPIVELVTSNGRIVAIGEQGHVFVLDREARLLRHLVPAQRIVGRPVSAAVIGRRLFIATHGAGGPEGSLYVIAEWAP